MQSMKIGIFWFRFFPLIGSIWLASSGALKGLRQDKSEEKLLRVLLLHVGCGFSMRETVVRAKQAKLAELSAVALFKRLRKAKDWLYRLCCALFEERGFLPFIRMNSPVPVCLIAPVDGIFKGGHQFISFPGDRTTAMIKMQMGQEGIRHKPQMLMRIDDR